MFRVLLVDDDNMVRFDFKRFRRWNEYGFLIGGEAEDGYEALQKIENENFDLAFIDIKMPRIDGLGLLSALKEKNIDLCVIIVSGYSDFEYARSGFKLGAFDYLIKPVNEENLCSLLETVKKHLDDLNEKKQLFSKTQEDFEQSLKLPYSHADEETLFAAIVSEPNAVLPLAENLTEKIVKFYEHDCFKIVTLLSSSYKSIVKRLLNLIPYLSDICTIESFPEDACYNKNDDSFVITWYVNSLIHLANYVKNFNLNSPDSIIRLFCEYLLNNLDKEISLTSAANEIGYNSKYISKIFKEKTGESYVMYITRLKMERACKLIVSGKYKIYEISEMLGYKTPDYFCVLFKKQYGITPLKYKSNYLH